ncbi:MAG: hypothetical protein ACYC3U_14645, partial [Georgenia sp.]
GTADLRAGEQLVGSEELGEALGRVPAGTTGADGEPDPGAPECRVRNNLSLALEGLGDEAAAAGDDAMALAYYEDAMDAIGACTSDGESATRTQPGPVETQPDEAEARQRDKADSADQGAAPRPEAPPQPDAPADPPGQDQDPAPEPGAPTDGPGDAEQPGADQETPTDPRLRELEERNRSAEQDRQEQEQRSGGGLGGGQNW